MNGLPQSHSPVRFGEAIDPTDIVITVEDGGKAMRLRQSVLSLDNGNVRMVEVTCGAGVGGDFVEISYLHSDGKDRIGVFHLAHVAAAWIERIDPDAPQQLLDTLRPTAAAA